MKRDIELAEVIQIQSHPRWHRAYVLEGFPLKEARKVLGSGLFRKALFEWSIEELTATAKHPETSLSDAFDAYHAILRFRLSRQNPDASIIQLKEAA